MPTEEKVFPADKKSHPYQARAKKPVDFVGLPDEAMVRLPDILRVTGMGRSHWLAGVDAGRYPKPIKVSE